MLKSKIRPTSSNKKSSIPPSPISPQPHPHLLPQQFGDAPPALGIQQQVPQQVAQLQVRALPFAHGHLRQAARGPGPNMGGGLGHGKLVEG